MSSSVMFRDEMNGTGQMRNRLPEVGLWDFWNSSSDILVVGGSATAGSSGFRGARANAIHTSEAVSGYAELSVTREKTTQARACGITIQTSSSLIANFQYMRYSNGSQYMRLGSDYTSSTDYPAAYAAMVVGTTYRMRLDYTVESATFSIIDESSSTVVYSIDLARLSGPAATLDTAYMMFSIGNFSTSQYPVVHRIEVGQETIIPTVDFWTEIIGARQY